jgi:hypothetical protein
MFKKLLAALVALAALGSTPALAASTPINPELSAELPPFLKSPPKANINIFAVRLIRCGNSSGTAFYIDSKGIFVTAYHVSEEERCFDIATGDELKS